jgi:hypothetical protein
MSKALKYSTKDATFFAKNCVGSKRTNEGWATARRRGGIRYAKAIKEAEKIGLKVIWDQDNDCDYFDDDPDDEGVTTKQRLENGELESLYAAAVIPKEGFEADDWEDDYKKRETLAAVGCVTVKAPSFIRGRPQDPYIRCVEAELIDEALEEAKAQMKRRLPPQKEILGAPTKGRMFSAIPVGKCFRWADDAQGAHSPYRNQKVGAARYRVFVRRAAGDYDRTRAKDYDIVDDNDFAVVLRPCPPPAQKEILGHCVTRRRGRC